MAISKILYIRSCGKGYAGKHLRQAIDYIKVPDKTNDGLWVSAVNCQADRAYEQMHATKVQFGKTDKRQGYHLIISFQEGEVDGQTAFEIMGRFVKEYLGKEYEAIYAVHDNTEHVHGHVIFNSVSFWDGKKYRYEKRDWEKKIQPITNRLCEEYGLSTIEISEDRVQSSERYKEWNDFRDGRFVWVDMIRRDLDACILRAADYADFLHLVLEMGYEVKNGEPGSGKYLAVKPMGLSRFRRCRALGEEYSEERIRERILSENLSTYQKEFRKAPYIGYCRVKHYKRAKLSGLQKRYFAKLYRCGRLKKRPYSQAWRYRDEIRKMYKLQEDYLFLVRHNVKNIAGVTAVAADITDKKAEVSKEKSRVYKGRERMKPLFELVRELTELQVMENCYQKGDRFFEQEHQRYQTLAEILSKKGYSVLQVEELRVHYTSEIARIRDMEKAVGKEKRIAERILKELQRSDAERQMQKQQLQEQKLHEQEGRENKEGKNRQPER